MLAVVSSLAGLVTPSETLAFVVPFVFLTVFSLWCTALLLHNCSEKVTLKTPA